MEICTQNNYLLYINNHSIIVQYDSSEKNNEFTFKLDSIKQFNFGDDDWNYIDKVVKSKNIKIGKKISSID